MTIPRHFDSVTAFAEAAGDHLGTTPWISINSTDIEAFSAAIKEPVRTDDRQHIPSWLLLARVTPLVKDLYSVDGVRVRINYGAERIQFLQPVAVGSRVRAGVSIKSAEAGPGGTKIVFELKIDGEGHPSPVASAEVVMVVVADV